LAELLVATLHDEMSEMVRVAWMHSYAVGLEETTDSPVAAV
jgi:hypothetical protein